jgi:hypothetical protein
MDAFHKRSGKEQAAGFRQLLDGFFCNKFENNNSYRDRNIILVHILVRTTVMNPKKQS